MPAPRNLPSIDALMSAPAVVALAEQFGALTVKQALRALQAEWRRRGDAPDWSAEPEAWAGALRRRLELRRYRPVFNLTGIVIHTNLGRALPSAEIFDAVRDLVTRPMNLEYDLGDGHRGEREAPVTERLCALTGGAAATVVNNNAAALMLVLNTLARDRAVPVSRGELIEIGGSFRLPDIIERAGCRLVEIGTTNRTHAADYRGTAPRDPALLLKVHPSNFRIHGFTREVATRELAGVASDLGVPLVVDLGSGTLVDLARWGLPHEPTPAEVLDQGADLVTFSGDKLLGGVQAGFIVGDAALVAACLGNPMKRALRADKITLALLDRVLAQYERPESLADHLPLLRTLTTPVAVLRARAERLAPLLAQRLSGFSVSVEDCHGQIGSGALPDQELASVAVRLGHSAGGRLEALQAALRALPTPVIGRVSRGAVWLDVRGAEPLDELEQVLGNLSLVP